MDFSKFGKKFQAVAQSTAKKAGEQVQIAKLQIDKTTVNKEMTDAFTALGKYCYLNFANQDMLLSGIKEYKRDIDSLKMKISEIENEIEDFKQEDGELNVQYQEAVEEPIFFKEDAKEDVKADVKAEENNSTTADDNEK